jgi:hypothetical protein
MYATEQTYSIPDVLPSHSVCVVHGFCEHTLEASLQLTPRTGLNCTTTIV